MPFTAPASSASLVVAALLLTGCATHLQGTVSSETDPNLPVRPDMVVLLKASEADESTALRNRRHLPNIADRLRERGFKKVFTPLSPPPRDTPVDLQATAQLLRLTTAHQYTAPDYGEISPARTGQLAMVSTITARNPPCSEEENFELLVENGLMRLSFDTTRTESFRVELAKDQCRR